MGGIPTGGVATDEKSSASCAPRRLADRTTLRVGGPARSEVEATTEAEVIDAVRAADAEGKPLLVLGGGSNVLISDAGFDGVVVRDLRQKIEFGRSDAHGDVLVSASAGQDWDAFVDRSIDEGIAGLEALSGIPGSVGAAPVQNIGAYGHDVGAVLESVRCWDRAGSCERTLTAEELDFGYRASALKRSMRPEGGSSSRWFPTPRDVVLEVSLRMPRSVLSSPVAYGELARRLDVHIGDRARAAAVREAVLELRGSKGMLLDGAGSAAPDYDRWSAGSFFTNPVVSTAVADTLPADAPRFPAHSGVKTSAAWLIERAGFPRGFGLEGDRSAARLSTRHTLALTNRGHASADDLIALARTVRAGVRGMFGIELEPEPVLVGVVL